VAQGPLPYKITVTKKPLFLTTTAVDYVKHRYPLSIHGSDTIYFRIHEETVEIMAIIGRQDLNQRL
jgi:toxin ParE1/3/4